MNILKYNYLKLTTEGVMQITIPCNYTHNKAL